MSVQEAKRAKGDSGVGGIDQGPSEASTRACGGDVPGEGEGETNNPKRGDHENLVQTSDFRSFGDTH